MASVKSGAAEYFSRLAPLKIETKKSGIPNTEYQNGRSGRCHCCPYGYHIDLDFVRYCQTLDKGSKNDNPTLARLKKMKKERRRQTKSMEVMLGISTIANGHPNTTSEHTTSTIIKESTYIPSTMNAAGRKLTPAPPPRDRKAIVAPPSPPPRRSSLTHPYLQSPPQPDLINSSNLADSRRSEEAADALKEAMLNFEETLENSRDSLKRPKKDEDSNLSSIDLLHHTPSSNYGSPRTSKLTATVGRSNSLPRQFSNEYGFSRSTQNWNTLPQSFGYSPGYNHSPLISEAMAALNAAQGFASNHPPDIDTLSMTSGMSGVSTSTLQSIREQMATGLSRLKDLEVEVKKVPSMQLKMSILKEEKRLLLEQVKALKNGTEPPLLPPSFDTDVDLSEDELETRLTSLRRKTDRSGVGRRRSPSPLRVNLEDFRSYRRARASSMSEGSDTESVHSYRGQDRADTKLFISETSEPEKRGRKTTPSSLFTRKTTRDVGVGCKVPTRDVGISYVAPRQRSIGVGTDRVESWTDSKKEVAAKPCLQCIQRSQKTFENKASEINTLRSDAAKLSMSTVSLESIDPHEEEPQETSPKNSFLHKLGKKSPLISRLSEPLLHPPVLTFDNSSNTEPIRTRDKKCNTILTNEDVYTKQQLDDFLEEAKKQWEDKYTSRQSALLAAKKPYMKDSGVQTYSEPKATNVSVGVQWKPSTRDYGVTVSQIVEKPKTRNVGVGIDTQVEVKTVVKTRSMGVGTDLVEEPVQKPARTIACGTSDYARFFSRSIAVGDCKITEETPSKVTKSTGCQALPNMKDVSVETTSIALKEPTTSLAGTPEVERRPFGSSGVRVCDKCHEAITSVAKDIVVGSSGPGLPTAPAQSSKIPRLVDQQKPESPEKPPVMAPGPSRPVQESRSLPMSIPIIKTKSPSPPPRRETKTSSLPIREDFSSNASSSIPSITGSPQVKRVPYKRQDTYTKQATGMANLVFDEGDASRNKSDPNKSPSPPKRQSPRRTIPKSHQDSKLPPPKTIREDSVMSSVSLEAADADHSSSSSSSLDEDSGDESSTFSPSHSVVSVPHSIGSTVTTLPPSISQQSSMSTIVGPDGKRKKSVPSRNMKAALKVLNDSIGKPARSGQQLTNAVNIVQKEWFKMSSDKESSPMAVEEYMDSFEDFSRGLLQRVVNLADTNGNTAMHYAVSNGNFDVVSVLLDSKVCNINQQNKAGYTASMLVALAQIKNEAQHSVVNRLFQLGDVNIKASQHGQTALMLAVSHGRLDMVRMLVKSGADVNIQDEDGSTALMCAAEHGHLAIVKFLSAQPDTDLYLMDNDGSTALTIAVEAGHKDVGVLMYKQMNLSRVSSPYSSMRVKRSRTPTHRTPRNSAPPSPGRSRRSSGRTSPSARQSSASLSNLII